MQIARKQTTEFKMGKRSEQTSDQRTYTDQKKEKTFNTCHQRVAN